LKSSGLSGWKTSRRSSNMRLLSYIVLRCVARAICGLYRCCSSASVAGAERRARLHQAVSFYQTLGTSLAITTLFWAFVLLAAASGAARHDYSDGIRVGADFILGAVAALSLGFFTAFVSQNSARYSQLPAQAAVRGRGEGGQLADSRHAPVPDADSRTACPQGYRARSVQPPRRGRHAHRDEVCGADRRAGSDRRHSGCCAVVCHHVPADGAQSEQCQLDLPRLQLRCGAKSRSRFPDPNLRCEGGPAPQTAAPDRSRARVLQEPATSVRRLSAQSQSPGLQRASRWSRSPFGSLLVRAQRPRAHRRRGQRARACALQCRGRALTRFVRRRHAVQVRRDRRR
jgi:hypothetical protein